MRPSYLPIRFLSSLREALLLLGLRVHYRHFFTASYQSQIGNRGTCRETRIKPSFLSSYLPTPKGGQALRKCAPSGGVQHPLRGENSMIRCADCHHYPGKDIMCRVGHKHANGAQRKCVAYQPSLAFRDAQHAGDTMTKSNIIRFPTGRGTTHKEELTEKQPCIILGRERTILQDESGYLTLIDDGGGVLMHAMEPESIAAAIIAWGKCLDRQHHASEEDDV